jgi:hypothetical protein
MKRYQAILLISLALALGLIAATTYSGFKPSPGATAVWTLPASDSAGCFRSDGSGTVSLITCPAGGAGSGDFSSNTSTSVDGEVVLFSGTGGKTGKRATTTGVLKGTSGVLSAATAGTDYAGLASTNAYTGYENMSGASWRPPETTVGSLPSASSNTGKVYVVTDGTSASDCTTGSGATRALCVSNGAAWTALGGAGGSGDFSSNTSTSVDGELVLFSGTGGKTGKRATGSGLVKATSGVYGTVTAPSGTVVGDTDTQTLTNKALTRRVVSVSDATSFTPNADTTDVMTQANTQAAGTLTANAPTGTPVNGQTLELRIRSTNQQTWSWNSAYVSTTGWPLPTKTAGGSLYDRYFLEYNSTSSKWELVGAVSETALSGAGQVGLPSTCDGRLTLTSGLAVTTGDVTGATSIYFTPYKGNHVTLFDGVAWLDYTFSELTFALGTLTNALPYDLFLYNNSGTLTLSATAWTNTTTRATALVLQDGVYVKSGATGYRYLGTFYTTATTTTEDSGGGTSTQVGGKRFLWNYYHRVPRWLTVFDSTDSWSYTTGSWRVANGASNPSNCVQYVIGVAESHADALVVGVWNGHNTSTRAAKVGVGADSTSGFSGLSGSAYTASSSQTNISMAATYRFMPAIGYHYLCWLEYGSDGTGGFTGDDGASGTQTGLTATIGGM